MVRLEHLARANPKDRQYRAHRAAGVPAPHDFLWDHGDLDGSRRDYLASISIGEALLREYPDDLEILDKHAASLNNLSILFAEAEPAGKARPRHCAEWTALRERLVAATPADDPRRELFVSNLGSCYGNVGASHLDNGALDEAVAWTRKALAIRTSRSRNAPTPRIISNASGRIIRSSVSSSSGPAIWRPLELSSSRLAAYLERLLHVRPGNALESPW